MADAPDIQTQVRETAARLGVDPDFAARIANQESRFNADAVSKAGARGVMQVMPATAKELAPRYGDDNIAQGVGYLKDLGDVFADVPDDQRPHFIAAAYNAGPSRVLHIMEKVKKGGGDPFNIASLADHLPAETLGYVANIGEAGPRAAAPSPAPAELTPPVPGAARRLQPPTQPLGQALWDSLSSAQARTEDALRGVGQDLRGLGSFGPGEDPSAMGALGKTGQLFTDLLQAGRGLIPAAGAGEVGGETLARVTGAVQPETGAAVGGLLGGLTPAAVAAAPRVLRALSPTLRAREAAQGAQAAAGLENVAAGIGQAGHAASQGPAGAAVQGVAEDVAARLQRGADAADRAATAAATPRDLRLKPRVATPERVETSPIVGPRGEPLEHVTPAQPARSVSEADYSTAYRELRRQQEGLAKLAKDFDNEVTARLGTAGPVKAAKMLARDPDLQSALLRHATPMEAGIIQEAIRAGQPFSQMPFSPDAIRRIGGEVLSGRGLFADLTGRAMLRGLRREAGTQALVLGGAHALGVPTVAAEAALIAGRLGLRAMDAMIASSGGRAALKSLALAAPSTPYAAAAAGAAVLNTFGRRLSRP